MQTNTLGRPRLLGAGRRSRSAFGARAAGFSGAAHFVGRGGSVFVAFGFVLAGGASVEFVLGSAVSPAPAKVGSVLWVASGGVLAGGGEGGFS